MWNEGSDLEVNVVGQVRSKICRAQTFDPRVSVADDVGDAGDASALQAIAAGQWCQGWLKALAGGLLRCFLGV